MSKKNVDISRIQYFCLMHERIKFVCPDFEDSLYPYTPWMIVVWFSVSFSAETIYDRKKRMDYSTRFNVITQAGSHSFQDIFIGRCFSCISQIINNNTFSCYNFSSRRKSVENQKRKRRLQRTTHYSVYEEKRPLSFIGPNVKLSLASYL